MSIGRRARKGRPGEVSMDTVLSRTRGMAWLRPCRLSFCRSLGRTAEGQGEARPTGRRLIRKDKRIPAKPAWQRSRRFYWIGERFRLLKRPFFPLHFLQDGKSHFFYKMENPASFRNRFFRYTEHNLFYGSSEVTDRFVFCRWSICIPCSVLRFNESVLRIRKRRILQSHNPVLPFHRRRRSLLQSFRWQTTDNRPPRE